MTKIETGLLADRVPYIRGGSGQRVACVFFGVNALFRRLDHISDPRRYARQVSRLLPQHRFTILGYAGSSFEEIVRDMAHAIPTPPDVVVGISLGGFVAMRFAAQHPELVRRLVLLVSAHRFSPEGWRMMERQFQALERGNLQTLVRKNALLFRRPWYNWLVQLKLWKDGDRLATEFPRPSRDSA
jgi:pimeloyl-ACP methyl ester carboxylesterase